MNVIQRVRIVVFILFAASFCIAQGIEKADDIEGYVGKLSPPNIATQKVYLAPISVTAPTTGYGIATNFDVPVVVSDTTGEGIFGYEFDLRFDSNVIQLQPAIYDAVGTISSGMSITVNQPTPGRLLLIAFVANPPRSGAGTLIILKFTTVGTVGQVSPLTWFNFFFNEETPQDITTNGQITILAPTAAGASVSGSVVNSSGRPVSNVRITLTDSSGFSRQAISNPFGFYSFEDIPVGSVYVLSAVSKRYVFQSRVVSVIEDVAGFNLVADP